MQFLIWSLSFLLLFALLASTRVRAFAETTHLLGTYTDRLRAEEKASQEAEKLRFELEVHTTGGDKGGKPPPSPSTPPTPLLYLEFPPHNSKLNLARVLKEKEEPRAYTEIFIRFLKQHYPAYAEAAPRLVEAIKERASPTSLEGKQRVERPQDLATLVLQDPELQEILYEILKEDLLEFITLEPTRHIHRLHIHTASWQLLAALFDDIPLAQEFVKEREALHAKSKRHTRSRKHCVVTETFFTREAVDAFLQARGKALATYESFLDFHVGPPKKKVLSPHMVITAEEPRAKVKKRLL